jgi:hypothetical protein
LEKVTHQQVSLETTGYIIKPGKKVNAGSLAKPNQHLAGCLGFPIHKKNAILLYGI